MLNEAISDRVIAQLFISDLHKAEHDGGTLYVPDCISGWKELDDGSYVVFFNNTGKKRHLHDIWGRFKRVWQKGMK